MQRLPLVCSVLAVLGLSLAAHGRPIDAPDDAALADAIVHGFEGIEDASVSAAAFVHGETLVSVTGGGMTEYDRVVSCYEDACQLQSYEYTPTILTFDPPIAAFALDLDYSVGPWAMEVIGSRDTELITSVSVGWMHGMPLFVGATDIGAISEVRLTVEDYGSYWDNLHIVEGAPQATLAEASIAAPAHDASVANGEVYAVDLRADAEGPADLASCEIVAFPPPGTTVESSTPTADLADTSATFDFGAVAAGDSRDASLELRAPDRSWLSCDDSLRTIAIVRGATGDVDRSDDIVSVTTTLDRSSIPSAEDCTSAADDDCDGLFNCLDDDCTGGASCPIALPDIVASAWPPIIPWIPTDSEGNPDLDALGEFSDPYDQIGPVEQCKISDNHGGMINAQPMCCAPPPPFDSLMPSYVSWLQKCTPLDPNYKTANPPTNALGFGRTSAGERIEYTITYENIGGVASHDVIVLDTLSAELDDATLEIEDGGVYDEATRTLTWIDPVLPPAEPHAVHFSIEVRADAEPGTRVQNFGTVIFQDAVPPSREDTLPIVHTIPVPGSVARAELGIAACESLGDDRWRVDVVNAGFGFAYDVRARIIDAPADFTITDDSCTIAHPDDEEPEVISVVVPYAVTPALDEIVFSAPEGTDDPCAQLLFELAYYTPEGEAIAIEARVDGDGGTADTGSGTDTDGEGSGESGGGSGGSDGEGGGCGCTTSPRGGAAWLLFALFGLTRARARRR